MKEAILNMNFSMGYRKDVSDEKFVLNIEEAKKRYENGETSPWIALDGGEIKNSPLAGFTRYPVATKKGIGIYRSESGSHGVTEIIPWEDIF